MIKLHELLAASGDTDFYESKFELWVHPNLEECKKIPITLPNIIKYAGNEVLYFAPDYHKSRGVWITIGIKE